MDKVSKPDYGVDETDIVEDIQRGRWSDAVRTVLPIVIGAILIFGSIPVAKWVDEPSLATLGLWMGWMMVAGCALAHVVRRIMFPYIDLSKVAARGTQSPVGAGLVFLGVCFVIGCLVLASGSARASTVASEIPPAAKQYLPILKTEVGNHWAVFSRPSIFAGQVEHESCVSLKHKKCFTPFAELKTDRERGVGLGQITKTSRFDALAEMVAAHPKELAGWSWEDEKLYDPQLQLRAVVLKNRDNYHRILGMANERERIAAMLVAYNGGLGRIISDRHQCKATVGCDPRYWYGHVEKTSLLPKVALKGYGRSFFQSNREYPVDVERRAMKYEQLMS